jgi:L-serine deaminase
VRACVSVEVAITANLGLVAKLLGQLVQVHEVRKTSILISADYLALRAALVRALRPYPDAARAVGAALHELETAAAKDITEAKRPLVIEQHAEAVAL